jgi:hypothetical protein
MSFPVKQHIIPRVLLKNFCIKSPFTHCIIKKNGYLKKVSINSYPTSNNIYTLENIKGELSFSLEKHYAEIENFFNFYYSIYKENRYKRYPFSKEEFRFPPVLLSYFTKFIWMIFFRTKSYESYSSNLLIEINKKEIKKVIGLSSHTITKKYVIKQIHLDGVIRLTMFHFNKLYDLFPFGLIIFFTLIY